MRRRTVHLPSLHGRAAGFVRTTALLGFALTSAVEARAADSPDASDPVARCIGENERSLDLRKEGHLLEARRELAACSGATCPDVIQQACRGRMADLNAAIPSIVFDVRDGAGRDLLDVQLAIDGQAAGLAGVAARQVDPGRHVFRFEATGHAPVERTLVLREGEKERPESIVIDPGLGAPPDPSVSDGATPPAPGVTSRPARADDAAAPRASSASGLRTAGWITGAAGLVTVTIGGVVALAAKASYDDAADCSGTTCTTTAGLSDRDAARTRGDVATGLVAMGAAATVLGLALWIAAPTTPGAPVTSDRAATRRARPTWAIRVMPGGLTAEGAF